MKLRKSLQVLDFQSNLLLIKFVLTPEVTAITLRVCQFIRKRPNTALREKCQMRSFFWSVSSRIWTERGEMRCISPVNIEKPILNNIYEQLLLYIIHNIANPLCRNIYFTYHSKK